VRIAILDYQIARNNPIGGCHLRVLRALAAEHNFTVFAVQFDNPCPELIEWVRIPAPLRPLPLLFLTYHLLAPIIYALYRLRTRKRFDVVQMVESNLSFGTVAYTHFCHTSYLKSHWRETKATGLRGFSRWLDHRLHASFESRIYRSAKQVLVPSRGLARELVKQFPAVSNRIRVLPNAVDVQALQRPASFDRNAFRTALGIAPSDIVFVFSALGHFERKGLPLLMEALARIEGQGAKLLVIGGTDDLVARYCSRAETLHLRGRVLFAGMQSDVRPYLWAADAFTIASTYETFSLVAFEAAAASLPLITPLLHGIEEIVRDGQTGYIVPRSVDAFALALQRFIALTPKQQAKMGSEARLAAATYDEASFVGNWRRFYNEWVTGAAPNGVAAASPRSIETV
jgi:glycosyltransferase involved in cell wall biosynthesis